jgi:exosortase
MTQSAAASGGGQGGGPLRSGVAALSPAVKVRLILVTAAVVGLYWRWLMAQHGHSAEHIDDWGHAYLIPLISVYLLWQERPRLLSARPQVFWPGLAPLMLGIMCYFFFIVGVSNHMLQGFSLVLTVAGATLLLTGPAVFRVAFLPIAYLLCGITVSEAIMNHITFPLQLIASQGAWLLLSIIGAFAGFSVDVSGNLLTVLTDKGQVPLNVAEACSGLRMVVAFIALGGAVALLSCRFWWQRTALLLLAAPVAIFVNVLRVAVLGIASIFNPALAQGSAHMLIGTLLLIPGLFLFLGVVWALNRAVVERDAPGAKK